MGTNLKDGIMNKQDELEALKAKQEHAQKTIGGMQTGCIDRGFKIATLEQEIADAEVKLRHGDYGYGGNWSCGPDNFVYTDQSITPLLESEKAYYADRGGQIHVNASKHHVLGNIFDDLKAIQGKNVTRFKVVGGSLNASGEVKAGHVCNSDGSSCYCNKKANDMVYINVNGWLDIKALSGFILKLRQMQATLKRKEAGK